MAKKKKSKKKDDKLSFNAEYHNLVIIFVGIFLLYSLNSNSMGLIGSVMQTLFKGLFGSLSIVIPFIVIATGILGFFEGNEYIYRLKNTKVYYVAILFIFVFYGLLNSRSLPVDSPLNPEMLKPVMEMGVDGQGCGLIATTITYYISKMFGITGGWMISIFALIIVVMFTFNISLKDLILNIKAKSNSAKNGNLNLKDKVSNMKKSALDMMTDEVDETTMIDKKGLFKSFMSKNKKNQTQEPVLDLDDGIDEVDDKTIKIVGFNKAEDEYLEILEGTQSMSELDVLKELQNFNKEEYEDVKEKSVKTSKTYDEQKTEPINIKPEASYENYKKPNVELLNKIDKKSDENGKKKVLKNASLLEKTLADFGVEAKVNQVTVGPTITRYEIQPSPGVKVSKIVNLTDDIALSLAAKSIRIEAPIPGKSAIGIEVPNENAQMVTVREVLESDEFKKFDSPLAMALGKDISGKTVIGDIGKMPHLLIAGSTGSGKSVCVNTLISSILYKAKPDEVKLLLIDPKVVELASYNGIPHLLIPVVTDPKKAANALNWAVVEMNRRYKLFADTQVKDISSYNEKSEEKLPKIVIIIDELADLMMASANDVEDYICRLAQMARAAGMHLIVATQRPSVDVITGVIKANIPSRIAFAVSSQTDSRTILDMGGAEKLLGKGDMLFYPLGAAKPVRLQGAFISEGESEKVIDFVKSQIKEEVKYEDNIMETISKTSISKSSDEDDLLSEAIEFVVESGQGSASMLQRKFKIGFNRAARLIDSMEERGIVGQSEGSKPRKVLMSKQDLQNLEGE
ncbi:FtsK/SpoIIIE family DNA translocase [Romboutsia sp.]|uniref:FtsK/SpoIIIE family DNA translocase n=1 Tax=Romboutsia sp. TaxID=1965302 RepID=UPI002BCCAB68|nr:DNA translocase FtsK 4TM domain-containing protein [Romboutsia sp.]HSQ87916.1 DNA translocase FtsK 4TM domain-containing protein [Romboutsia sp.]